MTFGGQVPEVACKRLSLAFVLAFCRKSFRIVGPVYRLVAEVVAYDFNF